MQNSLSLNFNVKELSVPSKCILLGSTITTCYHPHLIIISYWYMLNHLLSWIGVGADCCALAEAGLSVESTKLTLSQCILMHVTLLV